MGLESRESCQELSEVQRPDAYAVILAVICEAQEKGLKRRQRRRFGVSTDVRNRGTQAFWAMHVEAMYWSGMGVREHAAALRLSPYALRKWRDRLDEREVEIEWCAHLHPSARPVVGTGASQSAAESSLTAPSNDTPHAPSTPARRFFSDEQKLAIAMESGHWERRFPALLASMGSSRGCLFRWRRGAKETREACARRSHPMTWRRPAFCVILCNLLREW